METLSVVVITRNEEDNIGPCLESASWADEIVVVDSGSVDRTEEIVRRYTDKFYHRDWDGYTGQRNWAHDQASGDWILSLDADERVTPELAAEIKALLSGPPSKKVGWHLPYKVFWGDKWLRRGGFYPETHLRLFRRNRGAYGQRAVHEAIRVDGPTGRMQGHIEHYSWTSVSDYLERMQVYSDLSAREYHAQGRRVGAWGIAGHSVFTFVQMYFLKRGFLDGYEGFLLAGLYSMYTFSKYAKLRELNRAAGK